MIFQLGVLFLLGSALGASALPPCMCTKNLAPVCGSDGQTYNNACLLNCAQVTNPDLFMERRGRCVSPDQGAADCFCTYQYQPVCGSDGQSYPNKCSLTCAQRSAPVLLVHEGECRRKRETVQVAELPAVPNCACPFIYNPVCGSDGQTYDNACTLDCFRAEKPDLRIDHAGVCETDRELSCACTREVKPVCGSDGVTYNNPCLFTCAMEAARELKLEHFGGCGDSVKVVEPAQCSCTRERKPVCGTDGNTYSNPCLLNCARDNDESLHIDHVGPCDFGVNVLEEADNVSCSCTRNIRPVCASNGVTYNNECLMRCSGTDLTVARDGPCEL